MCGILYTNIGCKKQDFDNALELMKYRGPDAPVKSFAHNNHQFGHNRLSIIDIFDHSNQPFFSQDKSHVIIYNGEIYNYLELTKQFNLNLQTKSDTELVLELYLKLGPSFLQHLNGMFSIVIFNLQNNDIFVARDRLGIKPLYFYQKDESIIYSSEVAPILKLSNDKKIDELGERQYRKLRTFFNGRTIYSNIKMFKAGHYSFNGRLQKYWDLPEISEETKKPAPSAEEINSLLKSAVNYRMLADVPLGSYLSGGLDSSIISQIIAQSKTENYHSWTVGFKENNEFIWGQKVADHIGSNQHEILIDKDEFYQLLLEVIAIRQEPVSVPNEILIYKMTKEAKNYSTVLLSGEGADELFFGYDRIYNWANENDWDIREFTQKYAYGSADDFEIIEDAVSEFTKKYSKNIDIVSAFFQKSHLHGLLRRLDSASMLASVEARVPFVDHRLVELMFGVDFNDRTNKANPKKLLKEAFDNTLPNEIINRKKVGFPVDLDAILPTDKNDAKGYDHWLNINLDIIKSL